MEKQIIYPDGWIGGGSGGIDGVGLWIGWPPGLSWPKFP